MKIQELIKELEKEANPKQAEVLQGFFKTGKGQYGEGDIFLGIKIPVIRKIVKKYYNDLDLNEIQELLNSKIHEYRMIALLILVKRFEKHLGERKKIFDLYMNNTKNINNWDLVDLSAPNIVGNFLYHFGKEYPIYKILLTNLAKSSNLWERRISILATFYFIKNNRFDETLAISEILLKDKHDLIHKAVGWMLREVGKRNCEILEDFLKKHCKIMPRTMLRYSIEKFDGDKRQKYLKGEI